MRLTRNHITYSGDFGKINPRIHFDIFQITLTYVRAILKSLKVKRLLVQIYIIMDKYSVTTILTSRVLSDQVSTSLIVDPDQQTEWDTTEPP